MFDLFYGGKSASEAHAEGGDAEVTDIAPKPVDETTPAFRDIHIRNVWCRGARRAMYFNGLPEMNVERVTVENTQIYAVPLKISSTISCALLIFPTVVMANVP